MRWLSLSTLKSSSSEQTSEGLQTRSFSYSVLQTYMPIPTKNLLSPALNRWLDNQEVCQQLNISPLVSFSTLLATLSLAYSKVSFIRKFFPDTSPPFVMFLYFRLEALVGSILPFRPSPPCTSTGAVLLSW